MLFLPAGSIITGEELDPAGALDGPVRSGIGELPKEEVEVTVGVAGGTVGGV